MSQHRDEQGDFRWWMLWRTEAMRPLGGPEEVSELCLEGGEDLGSGSTFCPGRTTCAKALRWELARQLGQTLLLLGNQGTERGGDEQTKAMQLAEVELGAYAEGTRGWDPCRLHVSTPRPEPSSLRLEERQPPLPALF